MKFLNPFLFIGLVILVSSVDSIAAQDQLQSDLSSTVKGLAEVTKALDESTQNNLPCSVLRSSESNDHLVSDSFVKNLNCRTLTKENVFSSLQDDAFSAEREFQIYNWSSGSLGQCWALASAQRRTLYLTRFGVQGAGDPVKNGTMNEFLKIIAKDDSANVIQLESTHLKAALNAPGGQKSPLADEIWNSRALKSIIEKNQKGLFFRLQNLAFVFGAPIKDSDTNSKMFNKVLKAVGRGERPLLVMRDSSMSQHVVLIKEVKQLAENDYIFTVYDSNPAALTNTYHFKSGQFYMVKSLDGNQIEWGPTGFMLSNDDDMENIREISYKYYKGLCDQK